MSINYNCLSRGRDTWLSKKSGGDIRYLPDHTQKTTTKSWLVALLFLFALLSGNDAMAQFATIGSGTTSTGSTDPDPIHGYYESFRYQIVYTAAELSAAGLVSGSNITALGFSIAGDYGGGNLNGYTIKMGSTSATNSAAHNADATTVVKAPFAYNPTVTAAGAFDMITFSTPYLYAGGNIIVDICSAGPNDYTSPYGQVRTIAATTANGSRFVRSDSGSSQCGINTSTTNNKKPQIRFAYEGASACSGTPAPGNTITSASSTCPSNSVSLSLQNSTSGSGVTYQWQSAPNTSGPWTNITGATMGTYIATVSATTAYRGNVTCAGTTTASNPITVSVNPFTSCYPANYASSTADEEISNVTVGSLNNSSTCSTLAPGAGSILNRYSNYTSLPAPNLPKESPVAFSLTQTSCGGSYGNGLQIYIDYNQDGTYSDNERAYSAPNAATGTHTDTGSFIIPSTALLGNTGMRVIAIETSFPTATNYATAAYSWGETEDYVVNILPPPACVAPTAVSLSGYNAGAATLSWTASTSAPADGYVWEVRTSGTAGSGATGLVTTGSTAAGITTANVTGLANNTTYFSYVRSVCGVGVNSIWSSGPSIYTGACIPTGGTTYYLTNVTTTNGITNFSNATAGSPTGYTDYSSTLSVSQFATGSFTVSMTPSTGTNYFYVWVDWNNDFDFNDAGETLNAASGFLSTFSETFVVPAGTPIGSYRMRVANSWSGIITACGPAPNGEYEDYTFNVVAPPACVAPSGLIANSSTTTSATFSWNASISTPSAGYQWEVRASGAAGSGATGLAASGSTAAGVLTATATGLSATSSYSIYVRSNCDASGFSSWTSAATVITQCGAVTVFPFTETFETTSPTAGCILAIDGNGDGETWNFSTTNPRSGLRSGQIYTDFNDSNNDYMIMAQMQLDAAPKRLVFYARSRTASESDEVSVRISTTGNAIANFTNVALPSTLVTGAAYNEYIVDLSAYANQTIYIAFVRAGTPADGYYLNIDDVTVENQPTCFPVTNLTLSNVTNTSGTISWTASVPATSNGYQYEVRTSGAAGSGATGLVASGSTAAGVLTANITSLTAETNYTVYVRGNCGLGDFSTWVSTELFTGYCPVSGATGTYYISNFTTTTGVTTINNTSTYTPGGYANYTAISGSQIAGGVVNFTATTAGGGSVGFRIYIDWNNDFDFDDTNELAFNSAGYLTTIAGSFTVPAGLPVGNHRMRVVADYLSTTPAACGYSNYVEAEDYTFSVATPPITITSFTPTKGCTDQSPVTVVITGTNFTAATSVSFAGVNATSFTVNSATQITASSPTSVLDGPIVVTSPLTSATSSTNFQINLSPTVLEITPSGPLSVCTDDTIALSSATSGGLWSSSNENVATVLNGIVTPLSEGSTTISYYVTTIEGCTTTQTKVITVNPAIVITSNPVDAFVATGSQGIFSIIVDNATAIQWQVSTNGDDDSSYTNISNGGIYSGANGQQLEINPTSELMNGYFYRAVVSGNVSCGDVTSPGAMLNVGSIGIVSTTPADQSLCSDGTGAVTLVVETTGDVTGYAWYVSKDGGFDPIDANGDGVAYSQTGNQLSISGLTVANNGWTYFAEVSSDFGDPLYSRGAVITVNTAVTVSAPSTPAVVCGNTTGSRTLSVTTTGQVSSIAWEYFNGTSYVPVANGAPTGITYTTPTSNSLGIAYANAAVGAYNYRAVVSGNGACADAISATATLTVETPAFTISPANTSSCGGAPVALTANGAPGATYTWSPATGLSATTGSSVTASPVVTTTYTVTASNANGCTSTQTVLVTVAPAVVASATATPTNLCPGATTQLAAVTPVVLQGAANYAFTAGTAAFTEVSAGATRLTTVEADTSISTAQNIGFTFNYAGVNYTQFKMDSNGFISFNTAASSQTTNDFTTANASSRPIIAPLWDDLDGRATGGSVASYEVTGTSPNRVLTVEWRNWEWNYGSSTPVLSFQVKLYETSNVIKFAYRSESGAVASGSASIGLGSATGSGSGSYLNVTSVTSPAVSSTSSVTNINTKPATGTLYTWTPQSVQTYTYAWSGPGLSSTTVANPTAVVPAGVQTYSVLVTSNTGCSTTATVDVTAAGGVTIGTQPVAVTVCQGQPAAFTVAATGPTLTYQWRKNGVALVNGSGITGATTAALNLNATAAFANTGNIDVVVTPGCGAAATSNAVALVVNPTPTVTTVAAQTFCSGATVPAVVLSGTPSGVTFNITGGAAIGLADQTGVLQIPSYTALAGTATVTVTPNANGCPGTPMNYSVTINGTPTKPIIEGADATVCVGDIVPLSIGNSSLVGGVAIVGTGTTVASTTSWPNPLSGFYGGAKTQMLFTVAELNAQGIAVGTKIQSVSLDIAAVNTTSPANDFTIRMGTTTNGTLSGLVTGTSTVYGPTTYSPSTTGIVTFTLSTPFTWTGNNLIVEMVHNAGNGGNGSGTTVRATATTGTLTYTVAKDNVTPATAVAFDNAGTYSVNNASATRPNMRFGFLGAINPSWSPAAGLYTDAAATIAYVSGPRAIVYAKASTSGVNSYVATTTNTVGGCSNASDPRVITVNANVTYYRDNDNDGYGVDTSGLPGAANTNIVSCAVTAPANYSAVAGDCNDSNNQVYPGRAEILYNGIDNNCNGILDDGNQKVTKIQPSQCGATVATVYTSVSATPITGATGYTFHVRKLPVNPAFTPINDPASAHVVTNVQYFAMRDVPGVEYGTDYEVSVEVRMSGNSVFVGYVGEPCRIGTPPVLAPNVAGGSTQCGTTLPNFYSTVGTTPVASAVGYKFFIKDVAPAGTGGLPGNYVGESIERPVAWFTLSMFQNVGYGRTYELQVAVKTSANGAFSPYSAVCVITTPPAQPLVNCEASIPTKYANIYTTNLARVTQYEFELTNIGSVDPDPVTTTSILTSKPYFNFNQLPAANYFAGIEYGVRVRVYVNNIVSDWTDPCVVTSPAAAGRQVEQLIAGEGFNAIALPNPFANSFAISVSTSSKELVSYKVYDMTGRLLEARTSAVSEMESYQVGDRYPAGVYNVIVSQGTEVKTLRVIKR